MMSPWDRGKVHQQTPNQRPGSKRTGVLASLAVFLGIMALLLATSPSLAIVWDEGFTLGRQQRILWWLQALADPGRFAASWIPPKPLDELVQPDGQPPPLPSSIDSYGKLLESRTLEWFWPFAREEPHGHPPFYALLGLLGHALSPRSWEPLLRARVGPILLFSLVGAGIFGFFCQRWGLTSALVASAAWTFQPRLFAHAHYALYDGPLTALWIGAILSFAAATEPPATTGGSPWRPRLVWAVVFGIAAGCAAANKLTGWFLPLPFIVWTVIRLDRRGVITLLLGGVVAGIVLVALVPPWWHNPVGGIERFLQSNLSRSRTTRIPTLFLGRVILTPRESLPWYNTLVWTAFVVPLGFLLLSLAGTARALRWPRSQSFGLLVLLNWVFLLALRALPHTPGHDAERQFLAAFGCLALLAGLGAAGVVSRWPRWGAGMVAAACAEAVLGIALMWPVPLSYYSPAVGGLPGATRLGMEPTYYWDALGSRALQWLNQNTPPGEGIAFPTQPTIWLYLQQTGKLKVSALPWETHNPRWYVVQNRAGSLSAVDRALVSRLGDQHVLVQSWGVPLIWAFPYSELLRERGSTKP